MAGHGLSKPRGSCGGSCWNDSSFSSEGASLIAGQLTRSTVQKLSATCIAAPGSSGAYGIQKRSGQRGCRQHLLRSVTWNLCQQGRSSGGP